MHRSAGLFIEALREFSSCVFFHWRERQDTAEAADVLVCAACAGDSHGVARGFRRYRPWAKTLLLGIA